MREAFIRAEALKRGLDPRAVLAVAAHEGLSGGVGDGGHAFGPFQLNDAGGVITNHPASHHSNKWAWSDQGIRFALDHIAQVARGKTGRAAVTAITTRFERPQNPAGEIADAMAHYGQVGGGGKAQKGIQRAGGRPGSNVQFDGDLFRKQAGMILLNQAKAMANGQEVTSLASQMEAARKASTLKMQTAGGGDGGGHPTLGGGGGLGQQAIRIAGRQVGIPYVWGGESRSGFDCSGLVQYVYGKLGVKLPRTAAEQGRAGHAVQWANLKAGDLLVENNGDHVVMYAGHGKVIEAPHTGDVVKKAPLSWFPQSSYHARRVAG